MALRVGIRDAQEPNLVATAWFNLDRDMAETLEARQPFLVGSRRLRMIGDDRYDGGLVTGPDTPQMQIGDPVILHLQA